MQRRRRNNLRQRVLDGQVDLEALGVKRLTVPQEVLDKLPTYTYTEAARTTEKAIPSTPATTMSPTSPSVDAETGLKQTPVVHEPSMPATMTDGATSVSASLSQPTCAICLDDFEANETQVRELPCRHIFHPDCIDTFLLRNSSLCPLCKQSVLPKGDCPVKITNVMVRRERHINRMRNRGLSNRTGTVTAHVAPTSSTRLPGAIGSLGSRIGGAMTNRRIFSAPARTSQAVPPPPPSDIEMANATPPPAPQRHSVDGTPTQTQNPSTANNDTATPGRQTLQDCAPTHNRREWARQRAIAMLGPRHAAPASSVDGDVDEEENRPRWRKVLNKVFPGFR